MGESTADIVVQALAYDAFSLQGQGAQKNIENATEKHRFTTTTATKTETGTQSQKQKDGMYPIN